MFPGRYSGLRHGTPEFGAASHWRGKSTWLRFLGPELSSPSIKNSTARVSRNCAGDTDTRSCGGKPVPGATNEWFFAQSPDHTWPVYGTMASAFQTEGRRASSTRALQAMWLPRPDGEGLGKLGARQSKLAECRGWKGLLGAHRPSRAHVPRIAVRLTWAEKIRPNRCASSPGFISGRQARIRREKKRLSSCTRGQGLLPRTAGMDLGGGAGFGSCTAAKKKTPEARTPGRGQSCSSINGAEGTQEM